MFVKPLVDGKVSVKRYCYFTNKSDPLDLCKQDKTEGENIRRLFCQDCTTDKCNSASLFESSILLAPIVLISKLLFV